MKGESRAVLEKSIPGRRKRKGQAPGMGIILSVQGPAREPGWLGSLVNKEEVTLEI